ncbi:DNA-binding response regulator [Enterovibrio baiacu]|uniref:DNA-binding response regulator n=1 Tax=Enterovibrio baiacu TaxID=2491023 RepID=UPI003D0B25D0
MCQVLMIERVASLCGWVKTTFAEHGCKVTRVLHVKQAEIALNQCHFDLVLIASENTALCLPDIKVLRHQTVAPMIALLPPESEFDDASLYQCGVDKCVCNSIDRTSLWEAAQSVLSQPAEVK